MMAMRVLTLNCWGLKFVSKNRNERITALAVELGRSNYDLILLQEVWVQSDYEFIRDNVSTGLPHAKSFYSGVVGAGLVICSRFPIIETAIHPYSLNGTPIDILGGDWMSGKAAASVVIEHPTLGEVQIFNTHLFAKGGEEAPDQFKAHLLANAWEFSKLVLQAAQLGRHVIATGDFNCLPTSLPIAIIRDHAALIDAWAVTDHSSETASTSSHPQPRRSSPSALEAIRRYGITSDSPLNSYTAGKPLDAHARRYFGKRLDYIFYRPAIRPYASPDDPMLKAIETKVVFTERVPQYEFSFSDHFGVECTFDIGPSEEGIGPSSSSSRAAPALMRESTLSQAAITTTTQTLTSAYRISRARARRELILFLFCLVTLVGAITGSAWIHHYWINPICVSVAALVTWLGTTMLYEGFIYGRWEQNALRSLIEELEVHERGLELKAQAPRG